MIPRIRSIQTGFVRNPVTPGLDDLSKNQRLLNRLIDGAAWFASRLRGMIHVNQRHGQPPLSGMTLLRAAGTRRTGDANPKNISTLYQTETLFSAWGQLHGTDNFMHHRSRRAVKNVVVSKVNLMRTSLSQLAKLCRPTISDMVARTRLFSRLAFDRRQLALAPLAFQQAVTEWTACDQVFEAKQPTTDRCEC